MGKKLYAIQLQTGSMLLHPRYTDTKDINAVYTFESLKEARKENILNNGIIGTFNKIAPEPFKPLDKNDFILRARELLLKLGAVVTPGKFHSFQIKTRFGMLGVNLHVRSSKGGGPGDFMCQFITGEARDEAQKAGLFGLQKSYSGKWNQHYFGDVTVDEVIFDMESKLKAIGCGVVNDSAPVLFWMRVETANFTFDAFEASEKAVRDSMAHAWVKHCEKTGANPDYIGPIEDIPVRAVKAGTLLRDGDDF